MLHIYASSHISSNTLPIFSVIIFSLFLQISLLSSNFVIGFMTHLENCSEIVLLCDSFDFCRLYIWYMVYIWYVVFYSLHINNCKLCHVLCIFLWKFNFSVFSHVFIKKCSSSPLATFNSESWKAKSFWSGSSTQLLPSFWVYTFVMKVL